MAFTRFSSPIGEILLCAGAAGLQRVVLAAEQTPDPPGEVRDDEALKGARDQLLGYLAGRRRHFSVDLAPGGSDFQRQVWSALLRVPYGETRTYGQLARQLGREGAARAIGAASGANPLPLLIPCHRVVAADGLGGYSGGPDLKRRLLALEESSGAQA
ncbi:methylated-DNA--[protein]-cysteine S-methyltransferase [Halomonas rhizosphaerae]|uniref:Methylated-DNA--protein-cysteine methyltransferase n=1 Tax=Halomonas rhizosphaerae TaxID=3043296 RepID=A0ABT6V478_9GAMM|nr:methylated-DNA--[protein]-cysteine S-methyltransferase [Halomonas rhizosphaerae]MDI5893027.1 methylated-DNA--[protein]-cysteine S-methyltransferase [Halomonas rhizosphaerae]MDI5919920.1 methylated-DNA--[protein]-cysteine S-methyltransferase [Halomonas rhizosphaerae]